VKKERKMGQKTSVFAPCFLPFPQMTWGIWQMKRGQLLKFRQHIAEILLEVMIAFCRN
jgi:hypothetical protein